MHVTPSSAHDARDRLPRCTAAIEGGIAVGLHGGAQLFVARGGLTLADYAAGEARPGVPLSADSLMLWLSSTKPIGAAAIMQLRERGQVALDQPVARYLPDFAAHGKDSITLWHVLTHTGGFRWVDIGWGESDWNEIIDRICRSRPERNWVPGERAGYHPFSSWYILGEVVRCVDGRPFSDYVRQELLLPLGMRDSWIGMNAAQRAAYGDRISVMMSLERSEPEVHRYATDIGITACVPGGNGYGPMHDLGRFYQMLLEGGELDDVRVLDSESIRLLTTAQRVGMLDETFRHVMDWSLGLIVDSNRYGAETVPYGFGPHCSTDTFGHGGAQSSVGFADRGNRLVVALAFNGMPSERKHDARLRAVLTALYEDLGLAS